MARRLIIIGRGATAEKIAEIANHLGYDETRLLADLPDDLASGDHLIIAEEEHSAARDLLVEAARHEPLPEYVGFAAPHREGWKALVRLAAEGIAKPRIDAICAPAGVDVGAETPEEVAVAVAAELVALRRGRRRPSAGLTLTRERPRPLVEPRPRRLLGGFARPAARDDGERGDDRSDDDDGNGEGRN
jgi:xanthine dehydrogenase accessory factor